MPQTAAFHEVRSANLHLASDCSPASPAAVIQPACLSPRPPQVLTAVLQRVQNVEARVDGMHRDFTAQLLLLESKLSYIEQRQALQVHPPLRRSQPPQDSTQQPRTHQARQLDRSPHSEPQYLQEEVEPKRQPAQQPQTQPQQAQQDTAPARQQLTESQWQQGTDLLEQSTAALEEELERSRLTLKQPQHQPQDQQQQSSQDGEVGMPPLTTTSAASNGHSNLLANAGAPSTSRRGPGIDTAARAGVRYAWGPTSVAGAGQTHRPRGTGGGGGGGGGGGFGASTAVHV